MSKKPLQQRVLGEGPNAMQGSAVAYGCMSLFGGPSGAPEEQSIEVVRHALSDGITILNTSDLYGRNGENEIMLGKALKGLRRDQVIIVDKWGPFWGAKGMEMDASPARCRKVIDEQLARLQTDYIDVWVYRGTDPNTPIEDTVRAMKEAVDAGKVRHIGLSECSAENIRKAHAVHPITLLEQEWSLFSRDLEVDLLPTAKELGIGILAFSPLGRGMLTDNIKSLADLAKDDYRRHLPRFGEEAFAKNRILVDKLEILAGKKSCTTGQLALAWLLHKDPHVIPLFGTKTIKNLEANIAAADVALSAEEFQEIDTCFAPSQVTGDRSLAWAKPYNSAQMGSKPASA